MKNLKIGKLVFHAKALQMIAFAFFLDGVILGGFIAAAAMGGSPVNIFFLLPLLFAIWIPLFASIAKNVGVVK